MLKTRPRRRRGRGERPTESNDEATAERARRAPPALRTRASDSIQSSICKAPTPTTTPTPPSEVQKNLIRQPATDCVTASPRRRFMSLHQPGWAATKQTLDLGLVI